MVSPLKCVFLLMQKERGVVKEKERGMRTPRKLVVTRTRKEKARVVVAIGPTMVVAGERGPSPPLKHRPKGEGGGDNGTTCESLGAPGLWGPGGGQQPWLRM